LERKGIYEGLHPETKQGGDRKSEKIKVRDPQFETPAFTNDTAKKTGVSSRVIHEEIQVAKTSPPPSKKPSASTTSPKPIL
jgi:ParB family chromosome partitioning protein